MPLGISNDALHIRLSNNLGKINSKLSNNLKNLSTGRRINEASNDAAGLAVATALESQSSALGQSLNNIHGGVSMLNVAEGGLHQVSQLLGRGKDLAMQATSGTLDANARKAINAEFNSIKKEITRISDTTGFNGTKLINGNLSANSSNPVDVQVGPSAAPSNKISLNVIEGSSSSQLGIENLDLSTAGSARNALGALDTALSQVTSNRSNIGALTSRFSQASSHLGISIENLTAAASSIMDLDYATETSSFSRNQILQTAGISSLSKSNLNTMGQLLNIKV